MERRENHVQLPPPPPAPFFLFAMLCIMWDLSSPPGIEPMPPALGTQES